ncbi:MAG: hypothetical protein HN348_25935, partial [Proteobacteria bacterium]|nr:hypothetical protein [Pseudomonadota bacterium]
DKPRPAPGVRAIPKHVIDKACLFKREVPEPLKERDLPVTTRVVPDAPHGFDAMGPPQVAKEEVDRAYAFIESTVAEADSTRLASRQPAREAS